jgi:DNA modification methylase
MKTHHQVYYQNSKKMDVLSSSSVDLVVTSPPYPMIEMWDEVFSGFNPAIRDALHNSAGRDAFELMHHELDQIWDEVHRVLKEGGFACINIGDATRTINGDFRLYTNHARIISYLQSLGFSSLPTILWRKQTNAPNKFLGSGMLPAGAYVTLEHEYILIFRKGKKREFADTEDRKIRRESAFFWEERNTWFSDVWFDIKGTRQSLGNKNTRSRSAAYPFELAYRLIHMYSAKADLVLDPFLGIGTTMAAAMAAGRNSIGYEIDPAMVATLKSIPDMIVDSSNEIIRERILGHIEFCADRMKEKGPMQHTNKYYGFPVMTAQEKDLLLNDMLKVDESETNKFVAIYSKEPQAEFCKDWGTLLKTDEYREFFLKLDSKRNSTSQLNLFSNDR